LKSNEKTRKADG